MIKEQEDVRQYIVANMERFPTMKVPFWLKRDLVALISTNEEAREFIKERTKRIKKEKMNG